ncbi:MAG: sigma-70 family RNA polymerase sigma factor [Pirellulaceae bacterium]
MSYCYDAVIQRLETHRGYLHLLAESQLDRRLRAKFDADDVVQETMQLAYTKYPQLREPENPAVVKNWLREILCNVLIDHGKRYSADKRNVHLEQSLADQVQRSAEVLDRWLVAEHTSPSMAAARNEEAARLALGVRQLPDDMREVIVQRHLNNKSVAEIAELTGRSPASVAGLLRRGLAKLRDYLG